MVTFIILIFVSNIKTNTMLKKGFNHRINLRAQLNKILISNISGVISECIKANNAIYVNRNLYHLTAGYKNN